MADGQVELKDRRSGERRDVPVGRTVGEVTWPEDTVLVGIIRGEGGRLYNKENESLIGQSIRSKYLHCQTQSAQALDSIVCVLLALCYEELQP